MRMFHARTTAHVQHLLTRSYAQHKALNEFYDGIVDLADTFAEAYQGRYGLIEGLDGPYRFEADPQVAVRVLRGWIDKNRGEVTDDRELQNIVDEVLQLCDSTLYKLKFLA